jgi:hypothetical protein
MITSSKTMLFICAIALISSCKQNVSTGTTAEGEKIDNYLVGEVERLSIPGLTEAVIRNDSLIYSGAF